MIGYDGTWFSPFAADRHPRGNVTSVKKLISGPISGGTFATAYSQYDEAGNVVRAIDPRGIATTVSYADNFGDGANPDVGTSGTNGPTFALATSATNAVGHVVKTQYNYVASQYDNAGNHNLGRGQAGNTDICAAGKVLFARRGEKTENRNSWRPLPHHHSRH